MGALVAGRCVTRDWCKRTGSHEAAGLAYDPAPVLSNERHVTLVHTAPRARATMLHCLAHPGQARPGPAATSAAAPQKTLKPTATERAWRAWLLPSVKQPSTGCRVVSGRTDTAVTVPPTSAFVRVDLPAFGMPTTPSRSMRCSSRGGHRKGPHLGRVLDSAVRGGGAGEGLPAAAVGVAPSEVSTRNAGIPLVASAATGCDVGAHAMQCNHFCVVCYAWCGRGAAGCVPARSEGRPIMLLACAESCRKSCSWRLSASPRLRLRGCHSVISSMSLHHGRPHSQHAPSERARCP